MKKSYRMFIATAASAAMVASVAAPIAKAANFEDITVRYADSVDFLLSKGAKGISGSYFGVNEEIKRIDAAILTAKVLGLDTASAPAAGFTDVPARGQAAVNALKAAGITSGKTKTIFDSNSPITRGEVAMWLQRGFELKGGAALSFKDVPKNYQLAVQALVANGVTNGISSEQFGVNNNVKRGDFAIFLHKSSNAKALQAEVVSIQYVDSTTLQVKIKGNATEINPFDFVFDKGLEVKEAKILVNSDPPSKEVTVELKTSMQSPGVTYNLINFKGVPVPGIQFTTPPASGSAGPAAVNATDFSGSADALKVFYSDVRVDVTGVSKLENAVVKGDLYLKGNSEVILSNVTVEGDTILED